MIVTSSFEEQLAREADPGRRLEIIEEALCPPEPQLLDTSVLQNLAWVDRVIDAGGDHWSESGDRKTYCVGPRVNVSAGLLRGPLSFLPDRGDRLVASHALLANIPIILTTDRRTFWAHREMLLTFGVRIIRPGELLDWYIPYWNALAAEYDRRRNTEARSKRNLNKN